MEVRAGEELEFMRNLTRWCTLETWIYMLVAGCYVQVSQHGLVTWWDVRKSLSPCYLLGCSPTGEASPASVTAVTAMKQQLQRQHARTKPRPIPHGSRGSCAAAECGSLGLQEKEGSQETASSAQPRLVGLRQAMEGGMATYQLHGTNLS